MTLPTFRQQAAADYDAIFRNTSEFAETVTLIPPSGANVRQVVVMVIETEQPRGEEPRAQRAQLIEVSIGRNEASPLGGLARPMKGLMLRRSAAIDPGQAAYSWSGQVLDSTPDEWILIFGRVVTTSVGGQQDREVR